MELPSALFSHSTQNFSRKKFPIFFPKKISLKKFLIFSQNFFSNFQETELLYIFLILFLYFGKVIFITSACLELEAYSEPWSI